MINEEEIKQISEKYNISQLLINNYIQKYKYKKIEELILFFEKNQYIIESKPLIKWVGGKRSLLNQFNNLYPKNINNYYEPFLGGGAVFFNIQKENAILSDINTELINLYNVVKYKPFELIDFLKTLNYNKDDYLKIRSWDRIDNWDIKYSDVQKAGRFMYLNRTGFNGLYRVNSKGQNNVPFGRYDNPDFIQEKNILNVSKLFNELNITINNNSYKDILNNVKKGDFVYLDPPYDILSDTSNFTSYDKSGFGRKEQQELANFCKELDKKGALFMLSNNNTPFIQELYNGFNSKIVKANRSISGNGGSRGKIDEILIYNY